MKQILDMFPKPRDVPLLPEEDGTQSVAVKKALEFLYRDAATYALPESSWPDPMVYFSTKTVPLIPFSTIVEAIKLPGYVSPRIIDSIAAQSKYRTLKRAENRALGLSIDGALLKRDTSMSQLLAAMRRPPSPTDATFE